MRTIKLTSILTAFLLSLAFTGIALADDPNVSQEGYWTRGKFKKGRPGVTREPLPADHDPNSSWKKIDGLVPGDGNDLVPDTEEAIIIAAKNTEWKKGNKKTWTVKITVYGNNAEDANADAMLNRKGRGAPQAEARYEAGGWKKAGDITGPKVSKGQPPVYTFTIKYDDQPLEERIIFRIADGGESVGKWKVEQSTFCVKPEKTTDDGSPDEHGKKVDFSEFYIGSANQDCRFYVKEVWCFPHNVDVNNNISPTCSMPPGSGNWSWSILYEDPNTDPRPHGGVKWYSDGNGIEVDQEFRLGFGMVDVADDFYDIFFYDAGENGYMKNFLYIGPRPLITNMKSYATHNGSPYSVEIEHGYANVEPRSSGFKKLELEFAVEMDPNIATDPNNFLITPAGDLVLGSDISLSMTDPNHRILTIQFNPALPDQYCYKINVQGMKTASDFMVSNGVFPIRSLVGDVTRDGYVSQADVNEVNLYLGQSVNAQNAHCDIDRNGYVDTTDRDQVQARMGNSVAQCAGVCGDADHPYPEGDIDMDCDVDLVDFAYLGQNWLDNACVPPNCEDY